MKKDSSACSIAGQQQLGGWRAASRHWLPPSLSAWLRLTCCLPESFACRQLIAPAAGCPVSKAQD